LADFLYAASDECHTHELVVDSGRTWPQAERFLKIALATAEHTWQALAWEVNARVAIAELDLTRAQDCIAKALSTMEGFEVPLAAWRVHATACELCQRMNSRDLAERHLATAFNKFTPASVTSNTRPGAVFIVQ